MLVEFTFWEELSFAIGTATS